jgi:hypothetical protein
VYCRTVNHQDARTFFVAAARDVRTISAAIASGILIAFQLHIDEGEPVTIRIDARPLRASIAVPHAEGQRASRISMEPSSSR